MIFGFILHVIQIFAVNDKLYHYTKIFLKTADFYIIVNVSVTSRQYMPYCLGAVIPCGI